MLPRVALETTLLLHGVPRPSAPTLARDLAATIHHHGAEPTFIAILHGRPTVGLSPTDLDLLFSSADKIPKANTSNLGLFLHRRQHAATTVSTTMELAAGAGIQLFATGGLGGIHLNYAAHLDISADLSALTRFPVAVVCSGCKSILDVAATREALETLGIPVVGLGTDRFPEFYLRGRNIPVDARFDDPADLARLIRSELARTGRAIIIANPIPEPDAIAPGTFAAWLTEAQHRTTTQGSAGGREATPALLAALHEVSNGATLRANIALIKSNAALAAQLAVHLAK